MPVLIGAGAVSSFAGWKLADGSSVTAETYGLIATVGGAVISISAEAGTSAGIACGTKAARSGCDAGSGTAVCAPGTGTAGEYTGSSERRAKPRGPAPGIKSAPSDAGAETAYLQVLDLDDLDHLRLIAADIAPHV